MTNTTTYLEVLCAIKRGERSFWTRIGTAFPTKDGNGYRLKLEYFPTDASTEILVLPSRKAEANAEDGFERPFMNPEEYGRAHPRS